MDVGRNSGNRERERVEVLKGKLNKMMNELWSDAPPSLLLVKFYRKIKKLEPLMVCTFVLGLVLFRKNNEIGPMMIVMSMSQLACTQVFGAFVFKTEPRPTKMDVYVHKISKFAMANGLLGILFSTMHWPGFESMLVLGIISMIVVILFISIKKAPVFWGKSEVFKIIAVTGISLLFYAGSLRVKEKEAPARVDKNTLERD